MFNSQASRDGHDAGMAVKAGTLTPEEAGDAWLAWADRSYGAGRAFQAAYDRTGAER